MSEQRISALSFVFNEEKHIEASLEALRPYVDELIIVDLESTDRTNEIACKYADRVFIKPWALCGDGYKEFLHYQATGDWLLWWYPDELFPKKTAEALKKIIKSDKYDAYAFMRHEYMDGVRLNQTPGVAHGTKESPNYQNRLHRNNGKIFYTGLVHAEAHGLFHTCPMPPEYFMEHHKESTGQEYDNFRLYVFYKYLVWLYGDTKSEPYKEYVDSYRKIIHDSEVKNISGERGISLAEEFWQDWRKYADMDRITLAEFKKITGVEYADYLATQKTPDKNFIIDRAVVDEALTRQGE